MSNLSNIGIAVADFEEFQKIAETAMTQAVEVPATGGAYLRCTDPSGAEIWLQVNEQNEIIGFNPHFDGPSRRRVGIVAPVERKESPMDGALHAWADLEDEKDPESGFYPFVFDLPDFNSLGEISYPLITDIQLIAFPSEMECWDSEEVYDEKQEGEIKYASQSFVPSGLFLDENNPEAGPGAFAIFTGLIRTCERHIHSITTQPFYHIAVDTLGGMVDVVAHPTFLPTDPKVGGVLQGSFWLSGRVLPKQ